MRSCRQGRSPFSLRTRSVVLTTVPRGTGPLCAGMNDTVGGRRSQVSLAIVVELAAKVPIQTSSSVPLKRRRLASLPMSTGPSPSSISPVAVARAATTPSTYSRSWLPSKVPARWVQAPAVMGAETDTGAPWRRAITNCARVPLSRRTNELVPASRLRTMVCTPPRRSGRTHAAAVTPGAKENAG
jgi:hypothetical protein